jgi:hypothetical protein
MDFIPLVEPGLRIRIHLIRIQGFDDQQLKKFMAEQKKIWIKNYNLPIPRMSKLQKKLSALKREHPALQNMNFLNFFYFCGSFFALLDPDPDSEYGSVSGFTDPIESGSNKDPDPDPQP